MPNMLKKVSAHNSRVKAALDDTGDVTLASDDGEHVARASTCNNCEDECGGFVIKPTPETIQNQPKAVQDHCNCTARIGPCPLNGDCRKEKSCIYSCKVTRLDTGESETYTGLAGNTFKERFYGHNRNINTRSGPKNPGTTLSHYIWELKDNNVPYNTKWSILSKASTFNPVTKKCRLCLKEVYYILYKPKTASLNSRSEVLGWCKHRKQWSLKYT